MAPHRARSSTPYSLLGDQELADVLPKIPRHATTGHYALLGHDKSTLIWQTFKAGRREYCELVNRRVLTLELTGTDLRARGEHQRKETREGRCAE